MNGYTVMTSESNLTSLNRNESAFPPQVYLMAFCFQKHLVDRFRITIPGESISRSFRFLHRTHRKLRDATRVKYALPCHQITSIACREVASRNSIKRCWPRKKLSTLAQDLVVGRGFYESQGCHYGNLPIPRTSPGSPCDQASHVKNVCGTFIVSFPLTYNAPARWYVTQSRISQLQDFQGGSRCDRYNVCQICPIQYPRVGVRQGDSG